MIKHVFAIAAAISLLLCVGIGCLWFQSYRVGAGARRRFVLNLGRQMYMLRCDPGHVSVFRSPDTVAATQADAHVCDDARRIRNDDLDWKGWTWTDDDGSCSVFSWDPSVLASPAATDLAANCMPPQSPAVVPALLRAIDDPERFAVAHVLLVAATSTGPSPRSSLPEIEIRTPGEKELLSYCGLDLPIARADSNLDYHHYHLNRIFKPKEKGPHQFDPAQIPRIKAYWHDRLDVPVRAISYGWFIVVAVLPALGWLAVRVRRALVRRHRRTHGMCLACGYYLTGNPSSVCPECGTRT